MSRLAIRIQHLSKSFPRNLGAASLTQRLRLDHGSDWMWALDDVTVDIHHGESVGLIGGNGAGKTTLLRILSRLTRPTRGRAEIHGSVGALLEIGAGCHPELTGRENIYLNGALLGLRESQIRTKFATIVDFSGLGRSIDTPYKWYSSGMRTRLGFSIAVHLESDILLIDEALAVGDAGFRERGAERMRQLIASERTVLFSGHQLTTMEKFCDRVIWLDRGRVRAVGKPKDLLDEYLAALGARSLVHGAEE